MKKTLASTPPSQRIKFITDQKMNGVPAIKLHRAGATLKELRADHTTAAELKKINLNRAQLRNMIRTARALKQYGTRYRDMVGSTWEIIRLWRQGVPIEELRKAGYTATELLGAETTIPELKEAGYSQKEIDEATGNNK